MHSSRISAVAARWLCCCVGVCCSLRIHPVEKLGFVSTHTLRLRARASNPLPSPAALTTPIQSLYSRQPSQEILLGYIIQTPVYYSFPPSWWRRHIGGREQSCYCRTPLRRRTSERSYMGWELC